MKVSAIVTLLVGLVIGFAVGRSTGTGGSAPVAAQRPSTPNRAPPRTADATVYKIPLEDSPVRGAPEALVTLVEFSDYQCPYCRQAHTTVTQVEKKYAGKLRLVMKQFPLSFHPLAKPAALAAIAAGRQGKYWEMHDRLFSSPQLDPDSLERYARELGLDVERWKRDQQDPRVAAVIGRDSELGGNIGVGGTPAFFVNGRRLPGGAAPLEQFSALIDEELVKAEALVKQGVPPGQVYARLQEKAVTSSAPAAVVKKVDVPADAASFGPAMAKVTIVEFSDFQCPYCGRIAPVVKQLKDAFGGKDVRFVFRHYPLPMHPDAPTAARAAVAAQAQGKFWEMHDWMFEHQRDLNQASLEKAAASLGLDMARFKAAMASKETQARIDADSSSASATGVSATPTFFVNGREHVGGMPFEAFKAEIDREIARADKLLSSGVKPAELYSRLVADAAGPSGARN